MLGGKYGPFAETMAIAAALVVVFTGLLLKAVGKVTQWTYLAHDTPSFMVTAGARALAIAMIALTFIFINEGNYRWFGAAALGSAVICLILIGWFDRMRRVHVCKVPLLNADGRQKRGFFGSAKFDTIIVGSEGDMKPKAAAAFRKHAVSLCKFVSGYGENAVNDAGAIWPVEKLAAIGARMTLLIMGIFVCGVMTLYLTAATIEVQQRPYVYNRQSPP